MPTAGLRSAAELEFISRHPDALHGSLSLDPQALDTPDGVSQALRALADFDSFSASLRALLIDRHTQHVAETPLAGRESQPTRFGGDVEHAAAVAEIASLQNTSEAAAARTMNFSVALVNLHPALHEALAAGDITEAHARAIVDQASSLPESVAEAFGIEALSRLHTRKGRVRTPGEFRAVVRDLRERLHPESIVRRRAAAREDRRVWLQPDEDGMCTLSALLPAETATSMYARIDAVARSARGREGEVRTLAQLRADAFINLALADRLDPASTGTPAASVPSPEELLGGVKAEIVVHIPLAVALGASDDVAQLEGYGVIDADTARLLAAAAPTWQRIFTDDEGVPVKLGRSTYRPPAGLVRFIQYRDGTCLVPGCSCAARRSEIDHTIEWQDGGTTDAENLTLLCPKHHALKSLALFRLRREAAEGSEPTVAGAKLPKEPPKVSGQLLWETLLGTILPAEPLSRDHILGPRTVRLPAGSVETVETAELAGPRDPELPPTPARRDSPLPKPPPPRGSWDIQTSDGDEPPPF
ncbi:HNH endonuclease signature motif containing protein [Sinomonas sp. P10A9]|uniref:DUF222 domain-containing protein n=1 Tax=Sinomonas puerhi TaxID=3238584 RepID=A0AB39L6Q1_9MICC